MIRQFWASKSETILKTTQVIGTFAVTALGATLSTKPEDFAGWGLIKQFLEFNRKFAFLIIPCLSILVGAATFLKGRIGNLNSWNQFSFLLEEYKKALIEGRESL